MKMLRYLGLAVFVVCIAAFASGCGGGGGGGAAAPEEPPAMVDPGPSDEQRITSAREAIAGIVNDANAIEQAARSAVTAVEDSADATDEQIANARSQGNAALDAYRAIVRASGVAATATTPAQAEGAVASARAALSTLSNARAAAAGIQSAVDAVANLREQQAEEDRLATNGSSLIQHVRDNKLVYNALLMNLGGTGSATPGVPIANTIEVGATGDTTTDPVAGTATCAAPCAVYPADSGPSSARVIGERKVDVKDEDSDSTTETLTGPSVFPYGFDLKGASNKFVNAYTDITKTRIVSTRINSDNPDTTDVTEEFYFANRADPDSDYLLAGIWIDATTSAIRAFAYGSEPVADTANSEFCTAAESFAPSNVCATATLDFDAITGFVDPDKSTSATYRGDANGAYLADGTMSYFEADVTLNAEFVNDGGTTGRGTISGDITSIVAGGKSIAGSIELQEHTFADAIGAAFGGDAIGVVDGKSYSGDWTARFFGLETRRTTSSDGTGANRVVTTTYKAQAPGSVAGTFYATKQSAPAGDAAFIGTFGAHR